MKHPVDLHVSQKLKALRLLRGMTQKDLSKVLGVSAQQIQKYEEGRTRLSGSRLYESALALGVRPDFFFAGLGKTGTCGRPVDKGTAKIIRMLSMVDNRKLRTRILRVITSAATTETPET